MSSSQQCQSTEGRSELDGLSSCWQLIAAAADNDDDDDERWDEADCASVAAVTADTWHWVCEIVELCPHC